MRILPIIVVIAMLAGCGTLGSGPFPGAQGPIMFATSCANSPQFGGAYLCFDTTVNGLYNWNGTAFIGTSRDLLAGGGAAVVSNAVANYVPINGVFTPAAAAAEGNVQEDMTLPTVVRNLNCQLETAGGTVTVAGGTSYVISVRKNAVDTLVTCTILAAASGCSDLTHTASFVNNDLADIEVTPSGTPTALIPKCTTEMDY